MRFSSLVPIALLAALLAGCQPALTLEQAQALCTQQGGFLVVIYTQHFTRTRMGPVVAKPDKCVMPKEFEKPADATAPAGAAQTGAPQTGTPKDASAAPAPPPPAAH